VNEHITRRDVIAIILVVAVMVGSLVYGFFLIKKEQPKNCWDLYITENEAILHCEGTSK
jgi:hypothetical protein